MTSDPPYLLWAEQSEKYQADVHRVQVWDDFSDMFLDTSFDEDQLDRLAERIANSRFSIEELGHIVYFEVTPVFWTNLFASPGGVWGGFSPDYLIPACLKQQKKHPFCSNGSPHKVQFFVHLLRIGPGSDAYSLLMRAQHKRAQKVVT